MRKFCAAEMRLLISEPPRTLRSAEFARRGGSKSPNWVQNPPPSRPTLRPLGRFPFHFSHFFFFFLNGCNHILSSSWFLGSAGGPLKPPRAWHPRNVRIKRPRCRTLRFHLIIINCDDGNNDDDIMIESVCKQMGTVAKTWI